MRLAGTAQGACLIVVSLVAGAATARAGSGPTIPAGKTTNVALPAMNVVAVCTPPGKFHPNPTTWTINPAGVKVAGTSTGVPVAGSFLRVSVPKDHSPSQSITISWSGNTDCVSYNGHLTLRVGASTGGPVTVGVQGRPNRDPTAFAVSAVPSARRLIVLIRAFTRAPKLAGPREALLSAAVTTAGAFDLTRLSKPKTWALGRNPGVDLREGQLQALPQLASDLQKISQYDRVMLQLTNENYEKDPEFHAIVDHLAALDTKGATSYASLPADGKLRVATQVQGLSGSLRVLLRMASDAGKSAASVVFGQ
jgi:hypothetical protein